MVGSAPPFQRLDQLPSMVWWFPSFVVLQAVALSSSADLSSVALSANCVTCSSLGVGDVHDAEWISNSDALFRCNVSLRLVF
jgi:hypothetical protein